MRIKPDRLQGMRSGRPSWLKNCEFGLSFIDLDLLELHFLNYSKLVVACLFCQNHIQENIYSILSVEVKDELFG